MKLVQFLQKLHRENVSLELKNGTVIQGTVVGVDATMNCHLKKVVITVRGKNPVTCATLSVRGSTMRTWILPESLNLDALLVDETATLAAAKKQKQTSASLAAAANSRSMGRGGGGGGRGRGRGRR